MRREHAENIHHMLAQMYPYAHAELDFRNPFELLIATVLSAQTTDLRVNAVTPELFRRYPSPEALLEAEIPEIEQLIRSVGFYRVKAQFLQGIAAVLVHDHGGVVPNTLDELLRLPGVGRKTAQVVLGNVFGVPGLTIDTHFARLARRFGWSSARRAEVIEADVAQLFEPEEWTELSHRVIFHGRRVCHARLPACGACAIIDLCPAAGLGEMDKKRAKTLLAYELAPGQEKQLADLTAHPDRAAELRRRYRANEGHS